MTEIDNIAKRELLLFPLNLFRLRTINVSNFNDDASYYLELIAKIVTNFINHPDSSIVNLFWVTLILKCYSLVDSLSTADKFFRSFNIVSLVNLYQGESASFLISFLDHIVRYLQKQPPSQDRCELTRTIFLSIPLKEFAHSINNNLHHRLKRALKEGYTPESGQTLASLISGIADYFYKASNIVDDDSTRDSIRNKVQNLYSDIDFTLLGKLLEVHKKGIGIIARMIEMLRKSHCGNVFLSHLLSQIDFVRIAHNYNLHPVSGPRFTVFCKSYLSARHIPGWRNFFRLLDFKVVFRRKLDGKSGLNFFDSIIILQILRQIFRNDGLSLKEILSNFDFPDVGKKAKGKGEKSLNILFKRLLSVNLTPRQYRDFINGFGANECERLSQDKELNKILQYSIVNLDSMRY